MTIFFTASYYGKNNYQTHYDLVLNALGYQELTIVSPETGNYHDVLTPTQLASVTDPNELHYLAIKKGIELADAVVLEVSHQDFQVGFEAAYAVESKKHVLALSLHENFSLKIKHPYFHAAQYNEFTVDTILEDFLKLVDRRQFSERFNFYLSPTQLEFVQEKANQEGLNQSEYVRKLIDDERFGE